MSTFLGINANGLRIDFQVSDGSSLIQFNTGAIGALGAEWWVTELEGWDTPDLRQKWLDKAGAPGANSSESQFDKRSLVLSGLVKVPGIAGDSWDTQAAYWNAWNFFLNTLAYDVVGSETYSKLTVYEVPYPKYVLVKLAGKPKSAVKPGWWEFGIPLTAADPHKYLLDGGGPGSDPGSY